MPSTYSPNLAIELIGTGDQAGSWGSSTNTNLGTLIEQAVSGYATQAIADGADTVITIPNGASGVARNMFLECTGTLTAARNLVVPANRKLYYIFNNTVGGFAVTVKVSGQTGISVPNGKKMVLVSNGTDIFVATNHMVGTLVGNVTGNADTVTDGVYTTGNQTIAGTKTFSSPIAGSVTGNAATATTATTATNAAQLNGQSASFYQTALGFTPVQQGGGASQLTNKVYVGWSAGSKLLAQVDSTPLGAIALESSFTGGNQALTGSGYQEFPGGLIMQWGRAISMAGGENRTITYSLAFPNSVFNIQTTVNSDYDTNEIAAVYSVTNSTFVIANSNPGAILGVYWLAIGY